MAFFHQSFSKNLILSALAFFLFLFIFPQDIFAAQIRVAWDPNTEPDLAGYTVYYGTVSGTYEEPIDVGNVTAYTLTGLILGQTYYISVTAHDTSNNESGYSNEVGGPATDGAAPAIATSSPLPTGTAGAAYSQTLTATGGSTPYTWSVVSGSLPVGFSPASGTGVISGTPTTANTSTFRIRVTGANSLYSEKDFSLTISCPAAPAPSNPMPANESMGVSTSVNLSWTSLNADSYDVYFGTSSNPTLVSSITNTVYPRSGLSTSTVYYWKIVAKNNCGISTPGPVWSFTTGSAPDTISPETVITGGPTGTINTGSASFTYTGSDNFTPAANLGFATYLQGYDSGWSSFGSVAAKSYNNLPDGFYTFHVKSRDEAGNEDLSPAARSFNVQNNYQISCSDTGIQCLERADGGSDSNNLVNGKPKVDVEYVFQVTVQDAGGTPQYVKVFTTQRSNPSSSDFYAYDMACTGNYPTGASCTYRTMLGPAAVHKFYFNVKRSNGSEINYPSTGYITGPEIQLMNGNNLVGAPRNISSVQLSGQQAFSNPRVFRWNAERNSYTKVSSSEPAKEGEGYSLYKKNKTLPELGVYADVPGLEYIYSLKPGLNLVSNPYSGNVRLSDLRIQKGTNAPVSWQEAVARGWIVDTLYYYNGQDWGDTYSYLTSENGGVLVPWLGYWVDLDATDDLYYLVIPKP